ncbi:hypothetical protein [Planctellipticum variicoloris]|uniref:hypothetical protein n=1 Tax=Planctellipticum variicoloris TaxID=3064265 RepID=UPI0030137267|nr:hypothetical protein SH412_002607 [Planctomycetaceae bacterium SH412]
MNRLLLLSMLFVAEVAPLRAGEIGFVEDFALAKDREAALKQLIPGTEDYYYWHSLHLLQTEQFDKVDELLTPWVKRHNETPRVWEIRTRKALLTYDRNPAESLTYLRNRFGIHFPHQKEDLNAEPNLPTTLDPGLIARKHFVERAFAQHGGSLNGFEQAALDWLIATELNPDQRRQLLARLDRPDYPNLVKLVVADLNHKDSGGFGSLGIHNQLLKAQLDELATLKADVLNHQQYVLTYLRRLHPNPDVDWRHDPQQVERFLNRLQTFADRLAPAHNSLKAHVLYHRLVLDRSRGVYDKSRFLAYLKLPRHVGYVSKAMKESEPFKRFGCDLNASYDGATLLPAVGNDEPLVRSFLSHFFVEAGGTGEFETYVNDVYLKRMFAETKAVYGLGDPEQWASQLPPELFKQLRERIDLDFDFANKTQFGPTDAVSLDLHVKNVSTLIVKVFEINTQTFYRSGREIDTDINLDGLVANVEQTHQYNDAPLRRIKRRFEFPQLSKPGVYIVDFIGNGRSSRALIRKGSLKHLVRTTPVGQSFTILDGSGAPIKNASIWLAGHEYPAQEDGSIPVPFSTSPGRQPIVITAPVPGAEGATYSALAHFNHEPESYQFVAGFYVDRESLLTRKTAKLLVRPGLSLNGTPISLKRLEELKLTIQSVDLDGTPSSTEVPDFQLFEDRDSIHEFQVPQRLASLSFTLTAKIKQLTTGTKTDVAAADSFSLNGIDRTEKIEDLHLLKSDGKYILELRGRTGEARTSRPAVFSFKHRDFKDQVGTVLKTDPAGRVALGLLEGIESFTVNGPEGTSHTWALLGDRHTYSQTVNGRVGEPLTLPYLGKAAEPVRSELSLLEVTGGGFAVDRFSHLSLRDGLLVIDKLPAGDYDLLLKSTGNRIALRITAGEQLGEFAVGGLRQLETPRLKPLQIASITPDKDKVTLKLANASKFARVHVFGVRFVPEYDAYGHLSRVRGAEPYQFLNIPAESVYLTGRNIGDEYRYIIDRKYATKYPGNLLDRPSLLLNPWAVRDTETGQQVAAEGGEFGARGAMPKQEAGRDPSEKAQESRQADHFADLDFLSTTSAVLVNLIPNDAGVIEIPRAALGDRQHLTFVAVDPLNTTVRTLALPEIEPEFLDLRLANGLDPQGHFTRQKQISILTAGQPFTLKDLSTAKFESFDSLPRVYGLYATLSKDPQLAEFAFILNWPKLKPEEKQELYSKYASHELSFFLFKKDPEFFKTVVLPYLANKRDKTFMDRFLLEEDLSADLQPWNHAQLNIVERILLARRIADDRARTARHIADLYALLPPNPDRFISLFETAVGQSSLELDDALGLKERLGELEGLERKVLAGALVEMSDSAEKAPAAPAPAGTSSGVMGGMGGGRSNRPESVARFGVEMDKSKLSVMSRDGMSDRRRAGIAQKYSGAVNGVDVDSHGNAATHLFFDSGDVKDLPALRQLYRKMAKTREWAENNYHHLTIDRQNADLVTVNAFWKEFAAHDPAAPFLSRNLAEASRNFPEILLALAVLDLPFEAPQHETKFDGAQMTLTPGGPMVVFHEEILPAEAPAAGTKVLVSQNFYKHGDRQRVENGETVDKFVTEEFVIHTVYGCQVVITNPTSARQKLNVLVQIPRGSMPVLNGQATKTVHVNLEPFHTQTLEYNFYFPAAGDFAHFPVHVAKNEQLIAAAAPFTFHVVNRPTKLDTESWDYVSQYGSLDDVLTFLDKHNINELNLDRIAWRMHDKAAFEAVLPKLTLRHVYSQTLWSYALLHNAPAAAREFLQHAGNIVNDCGGRLRSTLLTIDPVARRTYEFLEYKPLVNARTHALGDRRQIVNDRFNEQYHRFLKELAYDRTSSDEELLAVTYYLLLQDRIEESLATFARINRANIAEQLQYDYCDAYLKFFSDDPEQARAIAAKYAAHPVDRWRNSFATIVAQLDEAAGQASGVIDPEDRDQQQARLAATEPSFDFTVEARKIQLGYQNLPAVKIHFYQMDVELLFSRNPFVQQFGSGVASIKPNLTLDVALPKDGAKLAIDLPETLRNSNVLVEIVGAGQTRTKPYFSNSLTVQVIENYGQVRVTHAETHKPASKAYVKVYAQTAGGEVKFYKDGYTDLRGRFDYASLNTNDLDAAAKFSILILSEEHGAVVRDALPPKQ